MISIDTVSLPGLLRSSRVLHVLWVGLVGVLAPGYGATTTYSNIPVEDDTWVASGSPGDNYGTAATLQVNAIPAKEIYLRFKLATAEDTSQTPIPPFIGSAPPKSVTLKLTLSATVNTGANKVFIYAANNNWVDTSLTWNSGPGAATPVPTVATGRLLAQRTINAAAGAEITFDVKDYISGAGEYTFCIRTNNPGNISFKAGSGPDGPKLNVEVPSPTSTNKADYNRTRLEVQDLGAIYIDRYFESNRDSLASIQDVERIGYFDVSKHPYNAKGDGSTDDTLAIQRAVNEARDARVAVYFPPDPIPPIAPRDYVVTATIECVQGIMDITLNKETDPDYTSTFGERWNHREYPCVLLGATAPNLADAGRSRLLVPPGTGFFNNGSDTRRPVLHFWSRGNTAQNPPTTNFPAASYNHLVRNLDIDIRGNADAIGIDMLGTQGTAIECLTISANGAYAGIKGIPGAGGATSEVVIKGGVYGIDAYSNSPGGAGLTSLLTHCTIDSNFDTQAVNSIRWSYYGPLVLVGCEIKGKPLRIDGPEGVNPDKGASSSNPSTRGNLGMVDSTIELTAVGPAISGTRSIYLRNVFCKRVQPVAAIETPDGHALTDPVIPSTSHWYQVKEYAEGAKLDLYQGKSIDTDDDGDFDVVYPDDPGSPAVQVMPSYIDPSNNNGITSITSNIPSTLYGTGSNPTTDPRGIHAWPATLAWSAFNSETSTVINVKASPYFAAGDGIEDDTDAIQSAIVAAGSTKAVFIPAGHYRVRESLELGKHTKLFGLHRSYSRLKADESLIENEFSDGGDEHPLVVTVSDAAATTRISDLMLFQRKTAAGCFLLHWRAGEHSIVQNVNFERMVVSGNGALPELNFPMVLIDGEGAGRWYSFNHQSPGHVNEGVGSQYRNILVRGASKPLRFYMFNPELDSAGLYNAEFLNRWHIDVYQSKFEGRHSPSVRLENCGDIRWIGMGGNAYCDEKASTPEDSEAVIDIDRCSSFVFSTLSFHANFLQNDNGADPAVDPLQFYRLKESFAVGDGDPITTPGHKSLVVYRQGNPSDD